ncbi:MAG: hypothetical protein KGY80_06240 [Candidatus Thorarchaeota archaeon]|nr:hypothetical protein [Candidatus Thorarchaeota archaeon]
MRRNVFRIAILLTIFVVLMSGGHSQTTSPVQREEVLDNRYSLLNQTSSILNHPSDIVYRHGTIGHAITWTIHDITMEFYRVYRNNKLVESSEWIGNQVKIDIDGLDVGTYHYAIIVFDENGKAAVDSVTVTVGEYPASKAANVRIIYLGFRWAIIVVAGTTVAASLLAEYIDKRK